MEKQELLKAGTKVRVCGGSPHHPGREGEVEFYAEGYEVLVLFVNEGVGSRTYISIDPQYAIPL